MKYFTKEVKIGLTGAVAIAALFIGLNFLKGINLFKSSNSYYIEFSDIKGLAKSGPVLANGYKIGTVRDILYNYQLPGHVLVEISVDESMRLPKGTKGTLVTEMLGGCNLNLLLGNPEDGHYAPGDTIQGDDTKGLMDKAADIVPQVEQIMGKGIARHVRYVHSGSENSLKALLWYEGHTFESKLFTFNILDRVGGGDAFASGLIYAMMHDYKPMDMVNFAVASSAIKHTIHGDANITDDVESIRNLMNMNYDIKR